MLTVYEKVYDAESLCDLERDIAEAFDPRYNPSVGNIPQDHHGFQHGEFTVTITWKNENEYEYE